MRIVTSRCRMAREKSRMSAARASAVMSARWSASSKRSPSPMRPSSHASRSHVPLNRSFADGISGIRCPHAVRRMSMPQLCVTALYQRGACASSDDSMANRSSRIRRFSGRPSTR